MKTAIILGLAMAFSGTVFASGFKCESADGLNVKLFNHVDPNTGTRIPAVLVISYEQGTLLVRRQYEIKKINRRNTVQYVVNGRGLDANTAILQIRFKEGREVLAEGERAEGQLILVDYGDKQVIALDCERYLKAE